MFGVYYRWLVVGGGGSDVRSVDYRGPDLVQRVGRVEGYYGETVGIGYVDARWGAAWAGGGRCD